MHVRMHALTLTPLTIAILLALLIVKKIITYIQNVD